MSPFDIARRALIEPRSYLNCWLRGAPPQCLLTFDLPHQPTPAEQLRLGQLDNAPLDTSSFGKIFANKILAKCP